jgi:quinol monooxygenase YgiN
VLVTVKFHGDVALFRSALDERKEEFAAVADRARGAGGVHHRFGVGDGFVLVVDEWESAQDFETFFGDPQLQKFIGSAGADMSTPPEITMTEAIDSPDQY